MSLLSQHSHSESQTSSDLQLSWFAYRGSPWRLAQVQTACAHLREAGWPSRQVLHLQHLLSQNRLAAFTALLGKYPSRPPCWGLPKAFCACPAEVEWNLWCAGVTGSGAHRVTYLIFGNIRGCSSTGRHLINPVQMKSWCYVRKPEAAYVLLCC